MTVGYYGAALVGASPRYAMLQGAKVKWYSGNCFSDGALAVTEGLVLRPRGWAEWESPKKFAKRFCGRVTALSRRKNSLPRCQASSANYGAILSSRASKIYAKTSNLWPLNRQPLRDRHHFLNNHLSRPVGPAKPHICQLLCLAHKLSSQLS